MKRTEGFYTCVRITYQEIGSPEPGNIVRARIVANKAKEIYSKMNKQEKTKKVLQDLNSLEKALNMEITVK